MRVTPDPSSRASRSIPRAPGCTSRRNGAVAATASRTRSAVRSARSRRRRPRPRTHRASTAATDQRCRARTSRRHRRRQGRRHVGVARGRCGRRRGSARARRPGVAAHAPGYDTRVTLFPGPSLDELRDAVDAVHRVRPLQGGDAGRVRRRAARRARSMLIGEVPGDKEDLAGHPFVGPAGKVLDEALADVGIDRAQIYLTNAVKHFKFERRGKVRIHKKPNAAEIHACSAVVAGRAAAGAARRPRHPRRRPRATRCSGRASASRSSGASGCRRRTAPRRSRRSIPRRCCERRPSAATRSTRASCKDLRLIAARVA